MALNLSRTFEELNHNLTHAEFVMWMAYAEIDPNGFWGANDPMAGLAGAQQPQLITGSPEELSQLIDQKIFGRTQ